ncbi:hypothetical protein SAMN05216276_10797 [Streptosporangium subroseum]|uniref:Uncharacterized protein n=1 Tax=Streptosporangium subroseum TaxID=106412 RepID=A0A239P319_9ACTN|nr:hypothetical protein [Streptosporangium subroseum]SNT60719.1 hypothetical protein SAMN05216276_10797 [Streptosporangium subroseum]
MADGRYDIAEMEAPKGPRRWIGFAVLAVLVAVPVIVLLADRRSDELPVSPDPVSIPARVTVEEVPNALYPKPRREDGREILDVVFPDGSKAEVGYPAELGLAKLGVRPAQGAWLDGHKDLYRQLTAPPGGPAGVAMGKPMIRKLTGKTTLWHPMSPAEGEVLLFSYGPWYMALHDERDGMPFEQRLLWAKNLRGKVTKGGYLVLSAKPPILLARAGEGLESERVGPQLWFGGAREALLVLAPVPGCDVESIELSVIQQRRRFSAEACQDGVYVAISGERGFVERAINGIVIKQVA